MCNSSTTSPRLNVLLNPMPRKPIVWSARLFEYPNRHSDAKCSSVKSSPLCVKTKNPVVDADAGFGGARIVGILEQLRQDMSRALNLLEQLVPRAASSGIRFQLIPSAARPPSYFFEVGRALHYLGASALSSSSAKS